MNVWNRIWYGPVDAARVRLLTTCMLLLLAFDALVCLAPRGAIYGSDGFNAAHFAWLDALAPAPTPAVYVGLQTSIALLARLERYAAAADAFARAAAIDPESAEAHDRFADACAQLGAWLRAEQAYHRAIAADAYYLPARIKLSSRLLQRRKTAEARTHLRHVVRTDPRHAEAHYYLGAVFDLAGQTDPAAVHYRRAIECNREMHDARFNLAELLLERGKFAAAHYEAIVQTQPDFPGAQRRLEQARRRLAAKR